MIGWYIGVLAIVIGIIGGLYFFGSLDKLQGDLKYGIYILFLASFVYLVFSSLMVVLGLNRVSLDNFVWQLVPILFFLSTILFFWGAVKFLKVLEEATRKK